MGAVPHSGNFCSGMCLAPCGHTDCWQCNEVVNKQMDNKAAGLSSRLMAAIGKKPKQIDPAEVLKALGQIDWATPTNPNRLAGMAAGSITSGMLGALPAQTPQQTQKATITRQALEQLCERAGIGIRWNNGDPQFSDQMTGNTNPALDIERKRNAALTAKVQELEAYRKNAEAMYGRSQQAASRVASVAVTTFDKTVQEIVSKKLEEESLRSGSIFRQSTSGGTIPDWLPDAVHYDAQALRADGASDEDIAAAKKLFGWKEPEATGFISDPSITVEYADPTSFNAQSVLTQAQLLDQIRRINDQMVGVGGVGVAPGGWKTYLGTKVLSQNVDKK